MNIQQDKKKTKKEYVINSILFHIVLLIIIYIASDRGANESWSDILISSFIFGGIISYSLGFLAYFQYEIYWPNKRRKLLHHNNLKLLLDNGFVINVEKICLEGKLNNYFVRIFVVSNAKLNKQRYVGQKYDLYVDIYFLEDIRLRKEIKSAEGLYW